MLFTFLDFFTRVRKLLDGINDTLNGSRLVFRNPAVVVGARLVRNHLFIGAGTSGLGVVNPLMAVDS
jgi:hypothetical protein